MDMNEDKRPDYRVGKYTINYDKLIHDILTYNQNEDRFHMMVNDMCLDIEAIDELVKFSDMAQANFVIQNVKRSLK